MTLSWTSLLVTLASVAATDPASPRPFHFENVISPILSRFQCNSSGCHGSAEGQNGFQALRLRFRRPPPTTTPSSRSRAAGRVQFAAVESSLLLRKASGSMPHGGGSRLKVGSKEYEMLRTWLPRCRAPFGDPAALASISLKIEPT